MLLNSMSSGKNSAVSTYIVHNNDTMLLECKNLTYRYPGTTKTILNNISFTLEEPGFHAIFGPSGVGKTSFAKILAGLLNGFDGKIVTSQEMVLYSYNLERLPGWASVDNHLLKITPPSCKNLKDELTTVFGLENVIDMPFTNLSLGQKNRVNLLRYLLQDFDILIMDESLANVDETTREKIILHIKSFFKSRCLLYISHNVVEVAKYCDGIVVFRDVDKFPQATVVKGCNHSTDENLDEIELNRSILEIMHAS